jgi:hypothetical protein
MMYNPYKTPVTCKGGGVVMLDRREFLKITGLGGAGHIIQLFGSSSCHITKGGKGYAVYCKGLFKTHWDGGI